MIRRLSALTLSAFVFSATGAHASSWTVNHGQDINGTPYAYAELAGDVTFTLSCQKDQPGLMRFLMTTDDLPGLPAIDDQSADLTLMATRDGTEQSVSFSPWYYGAESTWTGPLEMTKGDVAALFEADQLVLTNAQGETILTYEPTPSEADTQTILANCTFQPS